MNLKCTFNAMLIGESQEMKTKKSDGSLYAFTTVAVMQDGSVANVRMRNDFFEEVKKLEHFKQHKFYAEYNTDYKDYIVTDITPIVNMSGVKR